MTFILLTLSFIFAVLARFSYSPPINDNDNDNVLEEIPSLDGFPLLEMFDLCIIFSIMCFVLAIILV